MTEEQRRRTPSEWYQGVARVRRSSPVESPLGTSFQPALVRLPRRRARADQEVLEGRWVRWRHELLPDQVDRRALRDQYAREYLGDQVPQDFQRRRLPPEARQALELLLVLAGLLVLLIRWRRSRRSDLEDLVGLEDPEAPSL